MELKFIVYTELLYRSTGPDNYLLFVQEPPAQGDNTTSVAIVCQAQVEVNCRVRSGESIFETLIIFGSARSPKRDNLGYLCVCLSVRVKL